jgi:hypothetical protein
VTPASKRCAKCRQTKPRTAFYRHRDGRLSSYCKSCQRTSSRASYRRRRRDPDEAALIRARDRNREQQARALARGGEDD